MIPVHLPSSPFFIKKSGDMRVIENIGKLGYKHSTVIKHGRWKPGDIFWAHPYVESFVFELVDSPLSSISMKLQQVLADQKNFRKKSRIPQKNAKNRR